MRGLPMTVDVQRPTTLVGNRWVLVGGVVYLLEWVSGVAIVGAQLSVSPALQTLLDTLYFFPILFWIWMLWAGVLCWRRTPTARRPASLA